MPSHTPSSPEHAVSGVLLMDKPRGWTSFDVVNYVRKTVATYEGKKPKHVKVGHTGTLDPEATGLLVLLIGKNYTRRATELSKVDKTYDVSMTLGVTSSTGDEEGEKTVVSDLQPKEQDIQRVIEQFTGEQLQTPPAYSAVKIDGQRAYKLARSGQTVTIEPRPITIYDIQLAKYRYPEVCFTARVSSGTYIRSLVEDMGHALTTGAYMSGLRRTAVGAFTLEGAITPEVVSAEAIAARLLTL